MKTFINILALIFIFGIYSTKAEMDFYANMTELICKDGGNQLTDAQIADIKSNCNITDLKENDPLLVCSGKQTLNDRERTIAFCDSKVMACMNEPKNIPTTPPGATTPSPEIVEKAQKETVDCFRKQIEKPK